LFRTSWLEKAPKKKSLRERKKNTSDAVCDLCCDSMRRLKLSTGYAVSFHDCFRRLLVGAAL
jgi:hypothetical protein